MNILERYTQGLPIPEVCPPHAPGTRMGCLYYNPNACPLTIFRDRFRFLSNFYEVNIHAYGLDWRSTEHLFQALKAVHTSDVLGINMLTTPGEAKRAGRRIQIRDDWETGFDVYAMWICLRLKFHPKLHPDLCQMLMHTGMRPLVEGNVWHDNKWGNCTCDRCKNLHGSNLLGHLLMRRRKEIKDLLRE